MTLDLYLLHALGWSMAGAVLGVLLDRAVLALQQIARVTPQEEAVPNPEQPSRRKRLRRWFNASLVPTVLIVLAIGTAVQGLVATRVNADQDLEDKRIQNCQLAYANGFADAIDARAQGNKESQEALDELMATVGELTTSTAQAAAREKFRAALTDYLLKRATAKKQQQDHPYPPAPRDLCK